MTWDPRHTSKLTLYLGDLISSWIDHVAMYIQRIKYQHNFYVVGTSAPALVGLSLDLGYSIDKSPVYNSEYWTLDKTVMSDYGNLLKGIGKNSLVN